MPNGAGGAATSEDTLARLLGSSEFGAVSKVEAPSSVSTSMLVFPEEFPVVLVAVEVVASPVCDEPSEASAGSGA